MSNQRSSQRFERKLPVDLLVGEDWKPGVSRNLSLGGVFVETAERLALGTKLKVRFSVPALKDPIVTTAQVRWIDSSGVGLQFDGLRAREVWALGKLFDSPEP